MKPTQVSVHAAGPLLIFTWLLLTSASVFADPISFQVTNPSQPITSGGTVVFIGTVTNDSGSDLFASDFFFNFFNFNPLLTPTQLLGTPDFSIANNSTSPVVELFNVAASTFSPETPLSVDATLEDILNDVSATQTVTLSSGSGIVPEPPSLILLLSGLFLLVAVRQKHRRFQTH